MVHVEPARRAGLHEDHQHMLTAFLDRDADELVSASVIHNKRLNAVVEALPTDSGLIAGD